MNKLLIKRVGSFLFSLMLILLNSTVIIPKVQAQEQLDLRYLNLAAALGVMSDNIYEYPPEAGLTRAEFAQIISKISGMQEDDASAAWYSFAFSEDDKNVLHMPMETAEERFTDVQSDNSYYQYIIYAVMAGLMGGTSADTFSPDLEIIYQDAIKVFVSVLGYSIRAQWKGGYPLGYISEASELGLTKGIKAEYSQPISRIDAARLIYNALDVPVLLLNGVNVNEGKYQIDKSKTLLTSVMKYHSTKGMMSENSLTGISEAVGAGQNRVIVDGVVYTLGENAKYVDGFLGRNVEIFYTEQDRIIVYAQLTGLDQSIEIKAKEIDYYSNGVISYTKDGGTRTARVEKGAYVIYNGLCKPIYTNDIFDIKNGSITLVGTSGAMVYDLVIIEDYHSRVIENIDIGNLTIYNKPIGGKVYDQTAILSFETHQIPNYVQIIDNEGNPLKFEDLRAGDVIDVAKNDNVCKIIRNDTVIERFKVKEVRSEDPRRIISDGQQEFEVLIEYFDSLRNSGIEIDVVYDLKLNYFGQVVWLGSGTTEKKMEVAYLVKSAIKKELNSRMELKLFNSSGSFSIHQTAVKGVLHDANENIFQLSSKAAENTILLYKGILKYSLNDDNEINLIELPISTINGPNGIGKLYDIIKVNQMPQTPLVYAREHFDARVLINEGSTVFFKIPENIDEENLFAVGRADDFLARDASYSIRAYSQNRYSVYADYVSLTMDAASRAVKKDNIAVVTGITTTLIDGRQATKISAIEIANGNSAYMKEIWLHSLEGDAKSPDDSAASFFEHARDVVKSIDPETGKQRFYKVSKGDIIFFDRANADGLVKDIAVMYKADMYNPYIQNPGRKGWLAGTRDEFIVGGTDNNPCSISNNQDSSTNSGAIISGLVRLFKGSAFYADDRTIRLTTQDLSNQVFSPTGEDGKYILENYAFNTGAVVVEYVKDTVTVRQATIRDVKTYEIEGSDCSYVIPINEWGNIHGMIIINGER